MSQPLEDKLAAFVVGIMGDAFNRSLHALEDARAIDTTVLRSNYKPGTEFYSLVTVQLEKTFDYARPGFKKILEESSQTRT